MFLFSVIGSAEMQELIFEITQETDGGYCAECLTDTIVTEGDTWEDLRQNIKEAVKAFYFDRPNDLPTTLRLHILRSL
jgi:predicted RNase H-like HicB family nuclease